MTLPVYLPWVEPGWRLEAVRCNLTMQGIEPREWWAGAAPTAYPELIAYIWNEGEPAIIVEHDILPWPGALEELEECQSPWCGFPYIQGEQLSAFLGCTKLTTRGPIPRARSWMDTDQAVYDALTALGWKLHVHWPPVVHLNPAYRLEIPATGRADVRVIG